MKNFDEQLLRLKQSVGVTADQDVAGLLGMSKEAFHQRKKRDAFPEDKLWALATKNRELLIDVDYVLTGKRHPDYVKAKVSRIGVRIREVRGSQSLTDFAAVVGISPENLAAIEAGEANATMELLARIVDTQRCGMNWLYTGEHDVLVGELNHLEIILITNYRAASLEGRKALEVQAAFFAANNVGSAPAASTPIPTKQLVKKATKKVSK